MGLSRGMTWPITWLEPVATADSSGGRTKTWDAVSTGFVARRNIGTAEALAGGAVQRDVAYIVTTHYRTDLTTEWRAEMDGATYEIAAVRPLDRRRGVELDLRQVRS